MWGVNTVGDLVRYYPRGFEIFEDPVPVSEAAEGRSVHGGRLCVRAHPGIREPARPDHNALSEGPDRHDKSHMVPYAVPQEYSVKKAGCSSCRGRVVRRRDGLVMEHPEVYYPASKYEEKLHTMQPVYPLTAGLTNNAVIKAVRQALECADDKMDILPAEMSMKYHFPPYKEAVRNMHFPEDKEHFAAARERFVFEEFLVFILSLRRMKEAGNRAENRFHFADQEKIGQFLDALPYRLTGAQMKVWEEIKADMQGPFAMSRLVQGDVGSREDGGCFSGAPSGGTERIPGGSHGAHRSPGGGSITRIYPGCWKNMRSP